MMWGKTLKTGKTGRHFSICHPQKSGLISMVMVALVMVQMGHHHSARHATQCLSERVNSEKRESSATHELSTVILRLGSVS